MLIAVFWLCYRCAGLFWTSRSRSYNRRHISLLDGNWAVSNPVGTIVEGFDYSFSFSILADEIMIASIGISHDSIPIIKRGVID